MKLALVQAPAVEDRERNLAVLEQYVTLAAQANCQVICFPECFLTGYLPQKAEALAIGAQDPLLEQVSRLARDRGIDVLAGFMEREGTALYITQGLFFGDGRRDCYRKTHLGQREQQVFRAGDSLKVFTLSRGDQVGIALCVETHFPQIAQTLALRGAQVIFAPHAVPRASGSREAVWDKYIPARSYDNRVYMACCNLWDEDHFGGGCLVTGPDGNRMEACFREEAAILICQVDLEKTGEYRKDNRPSRRFYPQHRRKELYD